MTTSDPAADQVADPSADAVADDAPDEALTVSPNPFAPPSSWAATTPPTTTPLPPTPVKPTPQSASTGSAPTGSAPDPFAVRPQDPIESGRPPAPQPRAGDPWSAPSPWPSSDLAQNLAPTLTRDRHEPVDPPSLLEPAAPLDPFEPLDPFGAPLAPRTRRRARRGLRAGLVVPVIVLSLVAGAAGGVLAVRVRDGSHLADAGLPVASQEAPGGATRPAGSVASIAAAVLPSVVSIRVEGADGTFTGSGLVLRQDGYLLTNNHVVAEGAADGATITVLFVDGSEEPATIVGRTGAYDLAVIKVERAGLVPLLLGNSDDVAVGDPVIAVGAPLGLKGTVTTGIISALNRPVSAGDASDTAFINAIQTDAAINPGNSGGPLVNSAGEVVGINSAIAQPPGSTAVAGGSIGLGFAIPSNQARRTATQLIETGRATYPIVGVLLNQAYVGEGVQVATEPVAGQDPVSIKGPADKAGIRSGDIILTFDGRPMTEADELIVSIRAKAPGDTVTLRVQTGDRAPRDVRVVLDEATSQ